MEKFAIYFKNKGEKGMKDGYVKYFDESTGDIVLTKIKAESLPFPNEAACRTVLSKVRKANTDVNIRYVPLRLAV